MGSRALALATTLLTAAACASADPETGESAPGPSGAAPAEPPAAVTTQSSASTQPAASQTTPVGSAEALADGCPATPAVGQAVVHEGDLLLSDAASVAAAWSVTEITGNLELPSTASDLSYVSLPNLRRLGGSLNAWSTPFGWLHFPNLEEIGERLYLDGNAGLTRTDFRSLTRTGDVFVVRNLALQTVGLGALRETGSMQIHSNPLVDCLGPVSVGGAEPPSESQEIEYDVLGECTMQCGLWVHDSVGLAGVLSQLDGLGAPPEAAPFDLSSVVHSPDVPALRDLEVPDNAAPESLKLVGSSYLHYPDRYEPFLGHWLGAVLNDGSETVCDVRVFVELRDAAGASAFSGQGSVRAPMVTTADNELLACLAPGERGLVAVPGAAISAADVSELHFGLQALPQQEPGTPLELNIIHSSSEGLRPSVQGELNNDSGFDFADWRVDVFVLNAQGTPIGHGQDGAGEGSLEALDSVAFRIPLYTAGTRFALFPTPRL